MSDKKRGLSIGQKVKASLVKIMSTYDDTFYEEQIRSQEVKLNILNAQVEEYHLPKLIAHDSDLYCPRAEKNKVRFYYISDIHINHKLKANFPEKASEEEIIKYIDSVINEMLVNYIERDSAEWSEATLLITGDVSFDFVIAKLFYTALRSRIKKGKIIVTLGNHELWDKVHCSLSLEEIIKSYRKMLNELDIILLHNELLLIKKIGSPEKVSEDELRALSNEEIQEMCLTVPMLILGGIGFSGNNRKYNATSGLYSNVITTHERDMEESLRFESLHDKLVNAVGSKDLIVMTHMPMSDWSTKPYNKHWVYVNGHNHINEYQKNEFKTVYADNQVGYYNDTYMLKGFNLGTTYNIFEFLEDGIFDIKPDEYKKFYYGMGIPMQFKRKTGSIKLLKRTGFYLFMLEDKGKLYILDGGKPKKLDIMNIDYYYEHMVNYSIGLNEATRRFREYLEFVSDEVMKIGGSGFIHGTIIDIDFYNHINVNPQDGTIMYYNANAIDDRIEYEVAETFLLNHRPDLHKNLLEVRAKDNKNALMLTGNDEAVNNLPTLSADTSMYRPSRLMKSLQYLTNNKIIRVWKNIVLDRNYDMLKE